MIYRGITLDRFQKEAIDRIHENASVLVAAPTGAGKTLIAEYAVATRLVVTNAISRDGTTSAMPSSAG